MPPTSVYIVTRTDDDHHTDLKGRTILISLHITLPSANTAAKAHYRSQLREGLNLNDNEIEYPNVIPGDTDLFKGILGLTFENGARDRILVEVKKMCSSDDGSNRKVDKAGYGTDESDDEAGGKGNKRKFKPTKAQEKREVSKKARAEEIGA